MTDKMPATPLPWATTGIAEGCCFEIEAGGRTLIAEAIFEPSEPDFPSHADAKANAAYIVRASNSFPALLEALEDFVRDYDGMETGEGEPCPTLAKARAALAAAKGDA